VVEGLRLAAGCSIGWSDGRFMVAWWNAGPTTDAYVIGVRTFEPTF